MKVNVLGTDYEILMKKYEEEEAFSRRKIDGFCDNYCKEIVLCDMHTYPGWEHEEERTIEIVQKQILKHEIVHAFLGESGLCDSAHIYDGAWPKNEEMVDWIANQGEKLYKAWQEAGAL